MAGTGAVDTIGRERDTEKQKNGERGKFKMGFLLVIIIVGLIMGGAVYLDKKTHTPVYLTDEVIGEVNELGKKIKIKMLIMKKDGFSGSGSYKEANEIHAELELVRDKLIELKIKLKNKPWAN